ncbi:MAG: plastocyanin/azurin family copper-binding protein [Actinomycetota bacterium]
MRSALAILAFFLFILSAACSQAGETEGQLAEGETRIAMRDSLFTPNELTVRRGDEITFRFVNEGKLRHDAFIGDQDAQGIHEDEMRMADDEGHGGHGADEADAITVEPGGSGTLRYRFADRGETLIGCHEPGHYAAGMIVKVTVI